MKLFILSGPPAAGKNTVAPLLAKMRKDCVVIDVDTVRQMVVQPHKAPWEGKEGKKQQLLGVQNTCLLAKNFLQNKFDVIILDVLSNQTAKIYKQELAKFTPQIIVLLPTYTEILKRNKTRPRWLKLKEIKMLYETQKELKTYDKKINNSGMTPQELAIYLNN